MIASTQTQHPLAPAVDSSRPPLTAAQAHQRLKRLGVRMTKPRQAILEALFAEREPIAIDTLHKQRGLSRFDLVSLYRGLTLFADLGLVRRTLSFSGTSLYELNLGDTRFRVTCKHSHKRELLSVEVSAELARAIDKARHELETKGYSGITSQVEFFAVAPDAPSLASAPAAEPSQPAS